MYISYRHSCPFSDCMTMALVFLGSIAMCVENGKYLFEQPLLNKRIEVGTKWGFIVELHSFTVGFLQINS